MNARDRENKRRRERTRIKNGGQETRGRKSGKWAKYYSHIPDDDQWEFCQAIEKYKKEKDVAFLSWSEILDVVKSLGYKK